MTLPDLIGARSGDAVTLVYLAVAWAAGIWLAQFLWAQGLLGCATPRWPFAVLAVVAAGVGSLNLRRSAPPSSVPEKKRDDLLSTPRKGRVGGKARLAAFLSIFLILGAWRYQTHPFAACPDPRDLAFYNGDEAHPSRATVEGVIIGFPDVRDVRTHYRLRAETVTLAGQTRTVQGDLLVQAPRFPEYAYGDRLRVTGALQTPPVLEDFDYQRYLAGRGIHSLMRRAQVERVAAGEGALCWRLLYGLKGRSAALLNRVLPEPAAALANGMLLGIESGIPDEVGEAFTATGTTHVIVISGSNIALLSGVLMGGLSRLLGKRRAAWPAIALITLYVLLVGADPAALRAGLMGCLYVFAIYLGRQSTAYVSLCASGLAMTVANPLALWDIGFQLSFMATLGLILFTRPIAGRFERFLARRLSQELTRRAMGLLNDGLIVTLAAQILTLPLIVSYFGRLSLISLVTNFWILPAQPPIMTGGMATLVLGLLWEPLGRVLAVIPWLFLTYTTAIVRLTAAVPFASVATGDIGRVLAGVFYSVLLGGLLWREAQRRRWTTLPAGRALAWAAAIVAPVWLITTIWAARPDGRLHVLTITAADGEATLLTTPGGRHVWIWDGRGDRKALAAATRSLLRGRREVVLALGPDVADLWPGSQAIDPAQLAAGTQIRLGAEATLTRLAAGDTPAILIAHERFRMLLPAALTPDAQAALLARLAPDDLRLTVLLAPGPDTGAWPTARFLAVTAPQVIFWPEETTYPPEVAELLIASGAVRVQPDAIVEVVTNGEQLWVRRYGSEGRR